MYRQKACNKKKRSVHVAPIRFRIKQLNGFVKKIICEYLTKAIHIQVWIFLTTD